MLFDAFGAPSGLRRGWGYSAFIEHGGRRILFDTGGNTKDFAANASALGVDLKKLDFVALSRRHNDHTTFEVAGIRLLKRMVLIIDDGVITKVFYPVFPPDQSAAVVAGRLSASR